MLKELEAKNPGLELLESVRQWMVIREGSADEYNILRKADVTVQCSIAASLVKIADLLENIERRHR